MRFVRPKTSLIAAPLAVSLSLLVPFVAPDRAAAQSQGQSAIQRGLAISPVPLNSVERNRALVGLGSYIVNSQGACNLCHTFPNYAPGGDPFQGQPEQINTAGYMAGGRPFGAIISPNITPDENGLPAGLTLAKFIETLRTGHDPDVPGRLLQVMPWPIYSKMTDQDLTAVYAFLRSIPSIPR